MKLIRRISRVTGALIVLAIFFVPSVAIIATWCVIAAGRMAFAFVQEAAA